jgi:para-nitrobenzyl esterase
MHLTIDAWSLPDHPINIFDEALGNDVPILIGGDAAETGVFEGYMTDWLPALTKQKSNLYVYRFMHVPSNWKGAGILAPHGLEVRYLFDDLAGNWPALPGRPVEPGVNKDDEIVAENMMNMWAHFAATGDPSVEGMVEWPAFKAATGKDRYVTIDVKPELQAGFLEKFKPAK